MPITIATLVAGLPAGPATEAGVRKQLHIATDDTLDDAALEAAINGVNDTVIDFPFVHDFVKSIDPAASDNVWRPRIVTGANLLAARVFARRNSPEGVAMMGTDGAVYVQRNDPDVAMMLQLGSHAKPAIG
ncbi:hypothetical protein [Aeromicrobium fastidiosum]|uniref:Uncharacterized protein n=1 Tax=Aeromicrobium fastidiosum TaxID=52699 RepID=A0A641AUJ3_9ACTN|nr:hypothetical protein [Aeromicrobium fastidiosum]KAA1380518.1 hypothetical protein ESP62_004900 [Aeromicrobium fastidiosum]MBP2390110.1 hypothetical protein [Aeromicrobium fastidiosum]